MGLSKRQEPFRAVGGRAKQPALPQWHRRRCAEYRSCGFCRGYWRELVGGSSSCSPCQEDWWKVGDLRIRWAGALRQLIWLLLTKKGRETFLVPVDWVDDWPIFNGGQKISLDSGHPAVVQQKPRTWKDDFTNPDLQLGWYRKSKYNVLCYQRSNKTANDWLCDFYDRHA